MCMFSVSPRTALPESAQQNPTALGKSSIQQSELDEMTVMLGVSVVLL